MMVSPELGDLSQKAIAYARFAGREGFSTVPPKLNELAILVVAKHWSAEYVWNAHHTAAVRFGLPADVVEAIRVGKRPTGMEKDVEVVYDFANEFISKRKLSDATVKAREAGAWWRPRRGRSGRHDGAVSDLVDDGGARPDAAAAGQEALLSVIQSEDKAYDLGCHWSHLTCDHGNSSVRRRVRVAVGCRRDARVEPESRSIARQRDRVVAAQGGRHASRRAAAPSSRSVRVGPSIR